jgi:hypothetical protein
MPGITGMITSFNTPNYLGELFGLTPTDTPLLSAIGGLTGGQSTDSTIFTWQTYDLRAPDAARQRVEGADAPAPEARTRLNAFNVVEIHQEALSISYTRQAATGQFAATGSAVPTSVGVTGTNPVGDELTWQSQRSLEQIARDIEQTFITGTFAQPADNATPRRTRGLLQAIATNVITNANATALSEAMILDLLQMVWTNGGITVSETATLICGAVQKRKLTKIFITDKGYEERTRNVAGVNLQTIETDFGPQTSSRSPRSTSWPRCSCASRAESSCSPSRWPRPARATGSRTTARSACATATIVPTARSPTSPPPSDRRKERS